MLATLSAGIACLIVASKATQPDAASWHQMQQTRVTAGQAGCRRRILPPVHRPENPKPSNQTGYATRRMAADVASRATLRTCMSEAAVWRASCRRMSGTPAARACRRKVSAHHSGRTGAPSSFTAIRPLSV